VLGRDSRTKRLECPKVVIDDELPDDASNLAASFKRLLGGSLHALSELHRVVPRVAFLKSSIIVECNDAEHRTPDLLITRRALMAGSHERVESLVQSLLCIRQARRALNRIKRAACPSFRKRTIA